MPIDEKSHKKYMDKTFNIPIDKQAIENSKIGFSIRDYNTLIKIIDNYKKILTTSHVLTEVSNLNMSKNKKNNLKNLLFKRLMILIDKKKVCEKFIEIDDIIIDKKFKNFGVADIGILNISKNTKIGVITTDNKLWGYLFNNDITCLNI